MGQKHIYTKIQNKRRAKIVEASIVVWARDKELNLDKIIELSGGSKGAIYDFFGNKKGLEEAVGKEANERIEALMAKIIKDLDHVVEGEQLDEAKIKVFVRQFLKNLYAKKVRNVLRLLFVNASYYNQYVEVFYENGPKAILKDFSNFLQRVAKREGVVLSSPYQCSVVLLGMILAPYYLDMIFLDDAHKLTHEQVEKHSEWVVRILMNGLPQTLENLSAI